MIQGRRKKVQSEKAQKMDLLSTEREKQLHSPQRKPSASFQQRDRNKNKTLWYKLGV